MSAKDVIKNSFLKQFSTDVSTSTILIMLLVTALIGVYIFFVYRVACRKAFYSRSFAISLVAISMITAIIILTVQSSVVISLGMVGALSIVRFRTAIKDPMDLAFMFWAIAVGIICGANLYEIAILGSILITIVILALHLIPNVKPALLLLVNASDASVESKIVEVVAENTKASKVKSRSITAEGIDMIIELKCDAESELIKAVSEVESVKNVTLMEHDGEITY